jgi:hypothetical protein
MGIAVVAMASPIAAWAVEADQSFLQGPCRNVLDAGWKNMPDIADYVRSKPGADKLGYGNECHIGGLVFSQCWLEPQWSVEKAN